MRRNEPPLCRGPEHGHIEFKISRNHDNHWRRLVAVLVANKAQGGITVEEETAADRAVVLNHPITVAILADQITPR